MFGLVSKREYEEVSRIRDRCRDEAIDLKNKLEEKETKFRTAIWEFEWMSRCVNIDCENKRISFTVWEPEQIYLLAHIILYAFKDERCPQRDQPPLQANLGKGKAGTIVWTDREWDIIVGGKKLVHAEGGKLDWV